MSNDNNDFESAMIHFEYQSKQGEMSVPELMFYQIQARDKEIERLQQDFNSYRETAEETSQCYNDSYSDGWVFERALRKISTYNEEVIEPQSITVQWTNRIHWFGEVKDLAKETLNTVWKRREDRANRR